MQNLVTSLQIALSHLTWGLVFTACRHANQILKKKKPKKKSLEPVYKI